ncbi:MAG: NAD(P)/FAD-dependent oxidoreductase [Rhodospirillaceae bacterium]|nr:NAD(P)/FAD-dependent oxidoreductase [Rhodospirillaceae bacterium]
MSTKLNHPPLPGTCDVAIVGGGPSGLAAATRLKQLGVGSVVVLERESEAGGIPRHCGHPPFGMREFRRCLTGPTYAAALVERAINSGVDIHVNTSVAKIYKAGHLLLSTTNGVAEVMAKRVILSTGVRETPRAPRLVSGQRPLGVLTTGALQSMVYLKKNIPFRRPVIVGSELVSFSALLTCRHANIRPVAMIEPSDHITARCFLRPLPALLGVPLRLNSRLIEILGKDRVTGVRILDERGREQTIECDGVLFTGQFTPESSLLRMGHLKVDPASGGPVVDQYGRCSDPAYFATGNLLRPVETAGWCWREGGQTAATVARSLTGKLPPNELQVPIVSQSPKIRFTVPQIISLPITDVGADHLQLRFLDCAKGILSVQYKGQTLWSRNISARPERRVLVPLAGIVNFTGPEAIEICFVEENA